MNTGLSLLGPISDPIKGHRTSFSVARYVTVYTVAKLSWKKRPQNLYAHVPVRTNNNMAADHVIARVEKRKQTVVNVFIIIRIVLLSKIICQELKMIKKRGGTKCAYKNCHNNTTKSKNISFFRFPKEAERLVISLVN